MRLDILAVIKFIIWSFVALIGLAAASLLALWFWVAKDLPDPRAVLTHEAEACPNGAAGRNIRLSRLQPFVAEAFVAAEQPGYWQHHRIPSLRALQVIAIGSVHLLISDERPPPPRAPLALNVVRMQLSTMAPQRSAWWHAAQAVQSDRIELSLSKAELLDTLVNHISYGRGTFSLVCASQLYFGKSPETLDISDAAMLAALLRGPNVYDPLRHPAHAMERRNLVIDAMHSAGAISQSDAQAAKLAPLPTFRTDKR